MQMFGSVVFELDLDRPLANPQAWDQRNIAIGHIRYMMAIVAAEPDYLTFSIDPRHTAGEWKAMAEVENS